MTLNVAFTGTGWASKVHARSAQKLEEVSLSAVVNHRPESRAAFAQEYGIPNQYASVRELLAAGGVDVLVVSTPNSLHAPEAIAALKAGVHVMVEKPMAMNAAEAEAMVEAAEKHHTLLMVAHNFRFDPEVAWLKEQAAQGRLGKILRTNSYGTHVAWGPAGWFNQKALAGGGALADMGIHALDTTRFLLGEPRPRSVYARIGTYYKPLEVDDTGLMLVEWEGGATSIVEFGWWQPHSEGLCASTLLYGTRGFGRVYPTGLELLNEAGDARLPVESGFPPGRIQQDEEFHKMYQIQMSHFLDCVRSGRQPEPNPQESLVNVQIVDAAYRSSQTGEMVAL